MHRQRVWLMRRHPTPCKSRARLVHPPWRVQLRTPLFMRCCILHFPLLQQTASVRLFRCKRRCNSKIEIARLHQLYLQGFSRDIKLAQTRPCTCHICLFPSPERSKRRPSVYLCCGLSRAWAGYKPLEGEGSSTHSRIILY